MQNDWGLCANSSDPMLGGFEKRDATDEFFHPLNRPAGYLQRRGWLVWAATVAILLGI